jgi:hypothetical protein
MPIWRRRERDDGGSDADPVAPADADRVGASYRLFLLLEGHRIDDIAAREGEPPEKTREALARYVARLARIIDSSQGERIAAQLQQLVDGADDNRFVDLVRQMVALYRRRTAPPEERRERLLNDLDSLLRDIEASVLEADFSPHERLAIVGRWFGREEIERIVGARVDDLGALAVSDASAQLAQLLDLVTFLHWSYPDSPPSEWLDAPNHRLNLATPRAALQIVGPGDVVAALRADAAGDFH